MARKATFEIDIDAILNLDKILNSREFGEAFKKELQVLTEGTTITAPDFALDEASVEKLSDNLSKILADIKLAQVAPETAEVGEGPLERRPKRVVEGKVLPEESISAFQSRLRRMQEEFAAIGNYFRSRRALDTQEFRDKRTRKALTALGTGKRFDPVTGKAQVVTAGNVDRIFGEGTLNRVKRFQAALQLLTANLQTLQTRFKKTAGIERAAVEIPGKKVGEEPKILPATGAKTGRPDVTLQVLLNDLKKQIAAISGAISQTTARTREAEAAREREKQQQFVDEQRLSRKEQQKRRADVAVGRRVLREASGDPTKIPQDLRPFALTRVRSQLASVNKALDQMRVKFGQAVDQQRGFRRLTQRAEDLNKQIKLLSRSADKAAKATEKIKIKKPQKVDPSVVGKEAFADVGEKIIRRLGGRPEDTLTVPRGQLEEVTAALERRVKRGREELYRLSQEGKSSTKEFANLSKEVQNTNDALIRARQRMRGFGTVMQQTSALFRQFFRYAIGYGALYQALAAIRALIAGVVDLQASLKSIQAVTGATVDEMLTVSNGIREIALSTKFSTNEIAEAARILGQAGVEPQQFTEVLRSVATFAAATESSIETAADLVSTMRNVFTELSDQAIANQLTKAINISKLTAEDLKTILSRGAQVARGYNLTADQFLAAVTVLRNAGIRASTVATGFRQGLIELLSPDEKTLKVLKARYAQLGEAMSVSAISARFFGFQQAENPLLAVLREYERLGLTGSAEQQFQRVFDVRAVNAIKALIDNITELPEAELKLNFGDAALKASQTQMEALSNSVKNLGAAITVLADQVSGPLVEGLEQAVDEATKFVQRLTQLDVELKKTTGSGLLGAAGTGLAAGTAAAVTGSATGLIGRAARFAVGGAIGTTIATQAGPALEEQGVAKPAAVALEIGAALLAMDAIRAVVDLFKNVGMLKIPKDFIGPRLPILQQTIHGVTNWFKAIPAVRLKSLINLVRVHPFGTVLTVLGGLITAVVTWLRPDDINDVKDRLVAARQATDQAISRYKKQLQEFEEFRLSTPETPAAAGTTAAQIEDLQQGVTELDEQLAKVFGATGDDVDRVRDLLIRLNRDGAEAGTDLRKRLIKNIEDMTGVVFKDLGFDDRAISELAAAASDQRQAATALQEQIRRHVIQITDTTGELSLAQEAFMASYRELSQNQEVFEQLTGLAAATPQTITDLGVQLLRGMETYMEQQEIAASAMEEVTDAQREEMAIWAEQLKKAGDTTGVQDAMVRIVNQVSEVGGTIEDQLLQYTMAISRAMLTPEELAEIEGVTRVRQGRGGVRLRPTGVAPDEDARTQATRYADAMFDARNRTAAFAEELRIRLQDLETFGSEREPGQGRGRARTPERARLQAQLNITEARLQELDRGIQAVEIKTRESISRVESASREAEKFIVDAGVRREEALKVLQTEEFRKFFEESRPSERRRGELEQFILSPDITQQVQRPGRPPEVEVTPAAENVFNVVENYLKQKWEPLLVRKFIPDDRLESKIKITEERLEVAERQNLESVRGLTEELATLREKLITSELEVLRGNIRAADELQNTDELEKAQKRYGELITKSVQFAIEREKKLGETDLALRERRRETLARQTVQERLTIDRLEQEVAEAKKVKPSLLTLDDERNPAVRLALARVRLLDRQIEAEIQRASDSGVSEDEQLKAQAKAEELYAERILERRKVETQIAKESFDLRKKGLTVQKQIFQDQLQNIEQSLEFAYDQGDAERIQALTNERLLATEALLAVERQQLKMTTDNAAQLALFDKQAARRLALMRQEADLASKIINAQQQRFNRLRVRESEFGDFRETGALRARGTPVSVQASAAVVEANLRLAERDLKKIQGNLDEERKKLAQQISQQSQFATPEEALSAYERNEDITDEAIAERLKNIKDFQNRIDELNLSIGEMGQEFATLTGGIAQALQDGFNLNDLAKRLSRTRTSITNLGNTIQENLVKGMEDVSDAFADALVDGEDFTQGFRQAMSDMLDQIAKDIIKSGIKQLMISIFSTGGGTQQGGQQQGGFLSNLLSGIGLREGGMVEAKAKGGVVGEGQGGVIRGRGTGTSDSISGVVVDGKGRARRGIRVSDGEAVIRKSSTQVLGSTFINYLNKSVDNAKNISKALTQYLFKKPDDKFAAGGMIKGPIERSLVDDLFNALRRGREESFIKTMSESDRVMLSRELRYRTDAKSAVVKQVMKQTGQYIEKRAAGGTVGGVAKGPGTGISDAMSGAIVTPQGKIKGVLAFSDGEGIIKASSTKALGADFIHQINSDPESVIRALSQPPLKMASGGVIGQTSNPVEHTVMGSQSSSFVNYNFTAQAEVNNPDQEMPINTLRRLDAGLTQKMQEYLEHQMRPGGLLQAARG